MSKPFLLLASVIVCFVLGVMEIIGSGKCGTIFDAIITTAAIYLVACSLMEV